MNLRRAILTRVAIAASLLLFGTAAVAQQEKAPEPGKGQEMTMEGCLTKGTDVPQHYSFVDLKTGKKWTVTGPADLNLEKHSANHTVRITGNQTAKVFNVTNLEHVSGTCDPKGQAAEK